MALTKITKSGIANDSINAAKLENTSITSADIAPGTLTNAKLANSSITLNGSSVSLGGSVSTAYISWQTVKTTSFTAVAGEGYFCDTTSASITVTLPASPTAGDTVAIKDYAGTFATNNLVIARNSENIQGIAGNSTISTNRASVILVYADATKGWLYSNESNVAELQNAVFITATGGTITTSGDYKIHTFTGDGTFTVCSVGNPAGSDTVDYMVVAGGGGGGGAVRQGSSQADMGGGGGAGGFRESVPSACAWTASPLANPGGALPVSGTSYPVTVGSGGAGGDIPNPGTRANPGSNGSNSVFSTITSAGGGAGAGNRPSTPLGDTGKNGGSGGGASGGPAGTRAGGSGNTPPVSPSQGQSGGPSNDWSGAGGGGAITAGAQNVSTVRGGPGGPGATTSITGSPVTYAGGGGGGSGPVPAPERAPGGSGGGGVGGYAGGNGGNGGTNYGGGGGGGGGQWPSGVGSGGTGGKGVVILRYKYQ